jgi:hypothetical protein
MKICLDLRTDLKPSFNELQNTVGHTVGKHKGKTIIQLSTHSFVKQ